MSSARSLNLAPDKLLRLQQLASPVLPVGAYSYSEGLEMLVETGTIDAAPALQYWLEQELAIGSLVTDGAMLCRAYTAVNANDVDQLKYWNSWWSAARETQELRNQGWQMGRSLVRLLKSLDDSVQPWLDALVPQANWPIVFGVAVAHWEIDLQAALLAYFQGWAANAIGAGVKLIPLGQTVGQQLLMDLTPAITTASEQAMGMSDVDLSSCSWGLALASSQHEMQQVRLFQS
ncbi:urease accessory protein UreF [filamentous cyanobacterium LEGE 11480]|uniref:Urease accessory protein UreF n=1 Tax=Romeriopsis navalis LEGE 11480 TaxID=2777977 RepID=A0A928VUG2_9CYAN|nr:urease accessory protein UreF [Romeriopsis navalis]MBE9032800.1 urease accessory protein UreF [Romeriopsis navalis LEGE 11480]